MKKKKKKSSNALKPKAKGDIYLCPACGKKETIPEDVLEYFDFMNPRTPETGPHVFKCENCGSEIYPDWWIERLKRVTD